MKSRKLFTAFILSIFTGLITISQNSLGEQNNSVKQKTENAAPNTTQNTTSKPSDFKQEERHKREFKDALLTEIATPTNDGAAKPQSSASSAPTQIKNIRK